MDFKVDRKLQNWPPGGLPYCSPLPSGGGRERCGGGGEGGGAGQGAGGAAEGVQGEEGGGDQDEGGCEVSFKVGEK